MKTSERFVRGGLGSVGVAVLACGLAASAAACSSGSNKAGPGDAGGGVEGGSSGGGDASPGGEAGGGDAGLDNGEASSTYPAFQPPTPKLVMSSASGNVMATPHVRPVYFAGQTLASSIDDTLTQWFASSTWTAQVGEYGIGAATLETPVMLTETPAATLAHDDIATWLAGKLDGTHPEFGAVDAATLADEMFVLVYPQATTISAFNETSCAGFDGYHDEVAVGATKATYLVQASCPTSAGAPPAASDLAGMIYDSVVMTAGDPLPISRPAYATFDADHVAWLAMFGSGEISGPCFGAPLTAGQPPRTWSNAAMAGYHHPCVPVPAGAPSNFLSVPVMTDDVTFLGVKTKGIRLAVGQSKTVDVLLLSDGPTSGPWTVSADVAPGQTAGVLSFAFDRTTGQNGEKLHMTVTANEAGPTAFVVTGTLGGKSASWAGVVAQQ